jgi:uncharacterized membrane protein
MSLKKKLIITGMVIAVVVIGCIGGAVMASSGSDDNTTSTTTPANPQDTLAKVASKLNISVDTLEAAFKEARSEIQQEQLDTKLAQLVTEGKITQDQADAYKAWLNSRPSDSEYQSALKTWLDSNPLSGADIQLPGMGGRGGFGGGPGMDGGPGRIGRFGGVDN